MEQRERVQIMWAISFVVSGFVFVLAFMYSPRIGALVTLAYIMLYVGLSAVFLVVFKEIENLKKDTLNRLKDKKEELQEVEKVMVNKFYKKRLDEPAFRSIMQGYEKKLAEIEVKIRRLEGKK